MSHYKTAIRTASDAPDSNKFSAKARQLQELFPAWSNDDLLSLLSEVNGDVEMAAMRISEGHAEQWGSVSRKKEKKSAPAAKDSATGPIPSRGRGGGRGRGGAGRGGASFRGRAASRGTNGHVVNPASPPVQQQEQAQVVSSDSATPASWSTTNTWSPTDSSSDIPAPKPARTPATSKLSWAQVARPQPTPSPSSAIPAQPPIIQDSQGWEEPTTVQPPTWDDEPPAKLPQTQIPDPQVEDTKPDVQEPQVAPSPEKPPVEPEPSTPSAVPAQVKIASRPSSVSNRTSARFKTSDQPVVMPSSSSFGAGLEKVGMQFGSLSLGGETLLDTSEPEPQSVSEPEPATAEPPAAAHHEPSVAVPTPPASTSLSSGLYQQPQPQTPSNLASISTSISSPAVSSQQFTPQQQQQAPVQSLLPQQLQQQQQQQPLSQHHPYATQHALPAHLEPQPPQSQPQQTQNAATHSSYFRQNEAANPYFHTPTPPSAATQSAHATENPYGAFGHLVGGQGQGQHQQGGLLAGGFGGEYGYDGQRGFYESYQQSAFGARGLDDLKGLPGTQQQQQNQQPPNAAGLPPQSSGLLPSSQAHNQGPSGQQGAAQQGGAAQGGPTALGYGPPPPAPYMNYYNVPYPQNQYYGSPYGQSGVGYGIPHQGYPKYPMFQPGPPQGNANTAQSKQQGGPGMGGGITGGQSNPYGQALYQNQGGIGGYDEYHSQHQQPQHQQHQQHSLLGQSEYGKQLYGNTAGQGFMALGGQGGNTGSGTNAAPRGGQSPETSYKPYGGKDVGVGRGAPSQQQGPPQSQQQGGGQGQGPQGQAFYGGNRLGGGPQQSGHFPQAQNEYYYQPRQQQYWQ